MIIIKPPPEVMKPTDRDVDLYARALSLSTAPRKTPVHDQILNAIYWFGVLAVFAWFASMSFDREVPVRQIFREIASPDKKVHVGERLLIHGARERSRQCEVTRRWWIIDGVGRRIDFEPERFDAYGALGREEETIGPYIPLDAMPGRGTVRGVLAYDCNPLQRALGWSIVAVLPPLDFEILPRKQ